MSRSLVVPGAASALGWAARQTRRDPCPTLLDLGARYRFKLSGRPAALRFAQTNARDGFLIDMTDHMHRTDTWDRVVADYEAWVEPFTRQFAEAALDFAGGVAAGERVLDVAAGTGAFTLAAARSGARVLGSDFSPGMVARLSRRLHDEGLDRQGCEARVLDGQALDLPDNAFDAAFSIFGVMLFPDYVAGLQELHRVVRPGGRVGVAAWANEHGAGPALMFREAYQAAFPDRLLPALPPGMRALRTTAGLEQAMREADSTQLSTTTASGAWREPSPGWLSENADRIFHQFPYWATLDEAERLVLRGKLERLSATAVTDEGEVVLPTDAVLAVGVK